MSATVTTEQVEAVVYDALVELGPTREELHRAATFEALDVDSLDLVEVAQVVEEQYGVEITGEDAKQFETVGDAVEFVTARAS